MQTYLTSLKRSARPDAVRTSSTHLRRIGVFLIAIGALATLLPHVATIGAELLVAWMLTLWGAVGLWFSWSIRPVPEWRLGFAAFGMFFVAGVALVLFPVAGIAALTVLMMLSFLVEGIVSILFALRSSDHVSNWGWLVFSGLCSFAAGLVILFGWPWTASWTLGLMMGLNLISTGLSLVMLANSAKLSD
ncbi:HdeD family acid-resistance protein [Litorisediminicola beolgyonensis]|uniref:HdeD family acid-resistance protein n=1 Tax=Litorisediminicola beolgyonensis TaxID=1173614 RepID=A0ABW3ZHQ4_9RHOB